MKQKLTLFIFFSFFSSLLIGQSADKILDFIQTKDGRKFYGKIIEMKPDTSYSIQTYAEGNIIILKNEEIEIIKLGIHKTENDSIIKKTVSVCRFTIIGSVCHIHPFNKNSSHDILYNGPNYYNLDRIGIHISPSFIIKGEYIFGLLIGYERNFSMTTIPIGPEIKIGKKINDKSSIHLHLTPGVLICINKIGNMQDRYGHYYTTEKHTTAQGAIGIGAGYVITGRKKSKLFFNVNYRFETYQLYYYKENPNNSYTVDFDYFKFNTLLFKVGLIF